MRKVLLISSFLVLLFLVACPKVQEPLPAPQPNVSPEITVPSEGMIKLKAYTAMKSGTGYKAVIKVENLESTPTTAIVTIKLYYAKSIMAQKDLLVILGPGEIKQYEVQFDNVPVANALAVESPNLVNPATGRVTLIF